MESFIQGNMVRVKVTFTDINGVITDPTTITAKIENPNSVSTTYLYLTNAEVVRDGTGLYHLDFSLDIGGIWKYRFEGAGAVKAASQGQLNCIAEAP